MFTLTFHPNGATGGSVPQPRSVPVGGMVWVSHYHENGLYRTWYLFTGWNTQSDGGGTSYQIGDVFTVYADSNLFAMWAVAPVMVWEMVSAGQVHSLAIRDDGSLWAWGSNTTGTIGLGKISTPIPTPTRVGTDNNWTSVSAGGVHSLAIRDDGSLWAWGWNIDGSTGLGTDTGNTLTPTRVGTENNWVSVSAGGVHSLAIRNDGSLWAWGANFRGATGLGTSTGNTPVPTRVGTDYNWVSISAGNWHSLAVRDDGSLWAWGYNWFGVTGLGTTTGNTLVPTRVGTDYNWVSVSAGTFHSLALRDDESLWAWGGTRSGVGVSTNTPTRVGTANNWVSVSAGREHSLAIRDDGSLWVWGDNFQGQTGLGTWTGYTITPTRVGTANNWVSVSAGTYYSLAIRDDGLWAWGSNSAGQTGIGTAGGWLLNPTRVIMP